jgi:hypothetical protein
LPQSHFITDPLSGVDRDITKPAEPTVAGNVVAPDGAAPAAKIAGVTETIGDLTKPTGDLGLVIEPLGQVFQEFDVGIGRALGQR